MSDKRQIQPMPQDLRWELNITLGDRELAALDDDARFIIRRMVGEAYAKGFDHGWTAGQHDAQADRGIRSGQEKVKP